MNTLFKTILCSLAYCASSIGMDIPPKATTYLSLVESKPVLYVNISREYIVLGNCMGKGTSEQLNSLRDDIDNCLKKDIFTLIYKGSSSHQMLSTGLDIARDTDKKTKVRFQHEVRNAHMDGLFAFIATIRYIRDTGYNLKITYAPDKETS